MCKNKEDYQQSVALQNSIWLFKYTLCVKHSSGSEMESPRTHFQPKNQRFEPADYLCERGTAFLSGPKIQLFGDWGKTLLIAFSSPFDLLCLLTPISNHFQFTGPLPLLQVILLLLELPSIQPF